MKLSLDRTLKLMWLGIGALLLVFLAVGGLMILGQVIGNAGAASEAERVASAAPAAAQQRTDARPVRYFMPDSILGTATRIIRVGDGTGGGYGRGGYSSASYEEGRVVNVMFMDASGVRLLLDRPAFIRDLSYPEGNERNPARAWISYVIAVDDTDGSGELDGRDALALYVTDLEGRNLRPVLRPPLRYRGHAALDATRILVYALEAPSTKRVDEDRLRQRAFVYDVASGQLSPYAALDSAAARAAQVLAR